MRDRSILTWRAKRLVRRDQRDFNNAMVTAASLTAHTVRKISRFDWESKRSPSRLGRAGERADQLHKVVVPAMGAATALFGALIASMELWERYEQFRQRSESPMPFDDTSNE